MLLVPIVSGFYVVKMSCHTVTVKNSVTQLLTDLNSRLWFILKVDRRSPNENLFFFMYLVINLERFSKFSKYHLCTYVCKIVFDFLQTVKANILKDLSYLKVEKRILLSGNYRWIFQCSIVDEWNCRCRGLWFILPYISLEISSFWAVLKMCFHPFAFISYKVQKWISISIT